MKSLASLCEELSSATSWKYASSHWMRLYAADTLRDACLIYGIHSAPYELTKPVLAKAVEDWLKAARPRLDLDHQSLAQNSGLGGTQPVPSVDSAPTDLQSATTIHARSKSPTARNITRSKTLRAAELTLQQGVTQAGPGDPRTMSIRLYNSATERICSQELQFLLEDNGDLSVAKLRQKVGSDIKVIDWRNRKPMYIPIQGFVRAGDLKYIRERDWVRVVKIAESQELQAWSFAVMKKGVNLGDSFSKYGSRVMGNNAFESNRLPGDRSQPIKSFGANAARR